MGDGGQAKEAAILELTETLLKELHGLQTRLEDSFERVKPGVAKEPEGRPTMPNVLDEINENLQLAIKRVQETHTFIVTAVITKVHNM